MQLRHLHQHSQQITAMTERLEQAIGDGANIRRKPQADKIEGIRFAVGVCKPQYINRFGAAREQRPYRMRHAILCEVP